MKTMFEEDDLQIVNLNDCNNGFQFGATAKRPFAILIWADLTEEEANTLRKKLLDVRI